jgi:hypothetical protein
MDAAMKTGRSWESEGAPGTVCAGKKSIDRWQVAEDKICFIMGRATR